MVRGDSIYITLLESSVARRLVSNTATLVPSCYSWSPAPILGPIMSLVLLL